MTEQMFWAVSRVLFICGGVIYLIAGVVFVVGLTRMIISE